jgi:uncharacterized protein (DUF952 family)
MLFHITDQTTWKAAQAAGVYRPDSLENEGYIHLSGIEQVLWVANQFYRGQSGLVLLGIQVDRLQASLRYDKVPGQGTFPHLYGPLNLDAVAQVQPFSPGADGQFVLPADR